MDDRRGKSPFPLLDFRTLPKECNYQQQERKREAGVVIFLFDMGALNV